MTLDPAVHWALRGALALLLLHAAAHKLAAPAQFAAALSGYRVVPETLAKLTAAVVVASEVALGLALLVPGSGAAPALGAATLLGLD